MDGKKINILDTEAKKNLLELFLQCIDKKESAYIVIEVDKDYPDKAEGDLAYKVFFSEGGEPFKDGIKVKIKSTLGDYQSEHKSYYDALVEIYRKVYEHHSIHMDFL